MSALARERPPRPARASGGGGGGGGGGGESDFAREQRAEVCSRCAKDLRSCTDDQGTCEFRYTGCVRAGMPYVGDPTTYCY